MKKLISGIEPKNFATRLAISQTELKALQEFMIHDCEVWKLIRHDIEKSEPHKCVFFYKEQECYYRRGGSGGATYTEVIAHPPGAGINAKNVIRICFKVCMYRPEDEEGGYTRGGMVDVPIHLFSSFSKEEYDIWYKEQEILFQNYKKREETRLLIEFAEKYPQLIGKKIPVI